MDTEHAHGEGSSSNVAMVVVLVLVVLLLVLFGSNILRGGAATTPGQSQMAPQEQAPQDINVDVPDKIDVNIPSQPPTQ